MKQQRQAVVIVGADSKGYYIAPTLQGRGYQCIHVDVGGLSRNKLTLPANSVSANRAFIMPLAFSVRRASFVQIASD